MGPLAYLPIVQQVLSIINKNVQDKDQAAALSNELTTALLASHTSVFVDSAVKLMVALNAVWRPLISGIAFVYSLSHPEAMAQLQDIGPVGEALAGGSVAAFPIWAASRQYDKAKAASTSEQERAWLFNKENGDG